MKRTGIPIGTMVICNMKVGKGDLPFYEQLPEKNAYYEVRGNHYSKELKHNFIYLQELYGGKEWHYGELLEMPYPQKWFDIVQPPMDLSNLLKECLKPKQLTKLRKL